MIGLALSVGALRSIETSHLPGAALPGCHDCWHLHMLQPKVHPPAYVRHFNMLEQTDDVGQPSSCASHIPQSPASGYLSVSALHEVCCSVMAMAVSLVSC